MRGYDYLSLYIPAPHSTIKTCKTRGIISNEEYKKIMQIRKRIEELLKLNDGEIDAYNFEEKNHLISILTQQLVTEELITDIMKEKTNQLREDKLQAIWDINDKEELKDNLTKLGATDRLNEARNKTTKTS